MSAFILEANARFGLDLSDYASLYAWSIAERAEFWRLLWDFCGVRGEPGARVIVDDDLMPGARWFPDARLNFSENLLRRRDDADAIVFWGEDRVRRRLSHRELYDRCPASLRRSWQRREGAAIASPHSSEHAGNGVAMLASASLGATWSSSSPDFGVQGVVDRFGQVAPKVLFAVEGYYYNGKTARCLDKLRASSQRCRRSKTVVSCRIRGPLPPPGFRLPPCPWTIHGEPGAAKSSSRRSRSTTRSTSCFRRARRASRNASCTARAGRCSTPQGARAAH